jgi:hypothetical protein
MKKYMFIGLALVFLLISCEDDIVAPVPDNYGLTGRVLDKSGNIITGVKIYCLFNYYYFPNPEVPNLPYKISSVDSFGNALYQNFYNPVYNSAFVRYSLAADMDIKLVIKEYNTGLIKYNYSGYQYYGLYQHYLNKMVDSLQLENGCYIISLDLSKDGVTQFQDEKKMYVVSDLGAPNSLSDENGRYFFDYNKAFIADTIFYTVDGQNIYPQIIINQINFVFKKDGYLPEKISTELYPDILLGRDVILKEEELK